MAILVCRWNEGKTLPLRNGVYTLTLSWLRQGTERANFPGGPTVKVNALNGNSVNAGNKGRRRPQILAAAVYVCAALVLISYLLLGFHWVGESWLYGNCDVAGLLGLGLLIASAVCVLTERRFGYVLALAGASLDGVYLYRFYPYRYLFSPWLTFNGRYSPAFGIASLTILAAAAVVAAAVCSIERLAPKTWRLRKNAARDCTWPAFGLTLLFVFGWYLKGAVPYRIPMIEDSIPPIVSVWHVEKRGLQFHETGIGFYRDTRFYMTHDDHRLFQYSFRTKGASGVLTRDYARLLRQLASSPPTLPGARVSRYAPPLTWNGDVWFMVYYGRTSPRPIRTEGSTVPNELAALFYAADRLPKDQTWQGTARDVCFGFCYGPAR